QLALAARHDAERFDSTRPVLVLVSVLVLLAVIGYALHRTIAEAPPDEARRQAALDTVVAGARRADAVVRDRPRRDAPGVHVRSGLLSAAVSRATAARRRPTRARRGARAARPARDRPPRACAGARAAAGRGRRRARRCRRGGPAGRDPRRA